MPSLSSENWKIRNSPYINRFLQPDTIIPDLSNPQEWNRYSYVGNNPIGYNDPTGHMRTNEECGLNGEQCDHLGVSSGWIGHRINAGNRSDRNGAGSKIYSHGNAGGIGIDPGNPWNLNIQGRDRTVLSTSDDSAMFGGTRIKVQNGMTIWTGSRFTFGVSPDSIGLRSTIPTDSPFGSATSAINGNLQSNFGYTKTLESDVLNGLATSTGLDIPNLFDPMSLSIGARVNVRLDDIVAVNSRITLETSIRPDRMAMAGVGVLAAAAPEYGPAIIALLQKVGDTIAGQGGNFCPGGACP